MPLLFAGLAKTRKPDLGRRGFQQVFLRVFNNLEDYVRKHDVPWDVIYEQRHSEHADNTMPSRTASAASTSRRTITTTGTLTHMR